MTKKITWTQNGPYSEAVSLLIIPESDSSIVLGQIVYLKKCSWMWALFCCKPIKWKSVMLFSFMVSPNYPGFTKICTFGGQSSFFKSKDRSCFSDPYRHIFTLNCILTRKIILVAHLSKLILFRKWFATTKSLNLKSINQWFLMLPYNHDDLSPIHYRLSINSKNSIV